jgi:hypothetical protein
MTWEQEYKKLLQQEAKADAKRRAPTVMGSVGAGIKSVFGGTKHPRAKKVAPAKPVKRATLENTPTQGMGGYGASGDARRKAYIEKITKG